ncbi:MAG: cytochrome c1 [bacterium]|nr:cytochrome c1 [Gammaproteobacteria bacterium]HIL94977.1 cytochrome c1 [Pseudomonadales bacterium]
MIKSIATVLLLLSPVVALASDAGYPLDHITPDLTNKASLQRGAQTYVNYCLGCHSLKYQRYKRTATDLEIPDALLLEHLVFDPNVKIGDLIENSMSDENAKYWFGAAPPDLTLHSNLKGGPDWIYTYLRTFYEDESRPFGVNNLVFENVGMPHVLVGLQGRQIRPECKQIPRLAPNGGLMRDPITDDLLTTQKCGEEIAEGHHYPLEIIKGTGSMTALEYDELIYDLANFLYYMGEPARIDRTRIGVYVLLFLAFFYVFTWLLGREYQKEFHK